MTGFVLLALGGVCVIAGMFFMVGILQYLKAMGERINWFLLRLRWFQYLARYRELTIEQTGETGRLLLGYIISMISALVFFVTGALILSS
jgi:hypothetical protein